MWAAARGGPLLQHREVLESFSRKEKICEGNSLFLPARISQNTDHERVACSTIAGMRSWFGRMSSLAAVVMIAKVLTIN
jgi:hypothetical protein